MDNHKYDLDEWKDFVLSFLIDKNEGTLYSTVVNNWKNKFPSKESDSQKTSLLFKNCVLDCLESEFKLIRTEDSKIISITEKGKIIQKKGFRNYMNSLKRHDTIQRVNDYLAVGSGFLSLITTLISFVNLICSWWSNTITSFIPAIIFAVMFFACCSIKKITN